MKVYFENSQGERRVIAEIQNENEVGSVINNFIAECNAKKPAGVNPFKSYYCRSWENEYNEIVYDVGSHSEFFILKR